MTSRVQKYEQRTANALLVGAILFLATYAARVLWQDRPPLADRALGWVSLVLWLGFVLDLSYRIWLADRRLHYVATHLVDVLLVALPLLRPLRVLRVFSAAQSFIVRGGTLALFRTTQAVAGAATLLLVVAALAVLDAERADPSANITNFGNALWWAGTNITTVGYGDRYPVTGTGRIVALALMLVGVSLIGVITASVAAWFVAMTRVSDAAAAPTGDAAEELRQLRIALAALRRDFTRLSIPRSDLAVLDLNTGVRGHPGQVAIGEHAEPNITMASAHPNPKIQPSQS